jgi:radical SAM family uncharacterized protein
MRHIYADIIDKVAKPARYLGGEYQSVTKDWGSVRATVCLAFPDVYDIGMSHLGTKIIYSLLNRRADIACERAFAPWLDMEAQLRERGLPLVSLESQRPLGDFDVIGVSLQYELTFTNVLTMLELGGVALRAADRSADAPLVLAGGPVASHVEPMAPFFDAAFIGEAEEQLAALALAWADGRRAIRAGTTTRRDVLADLAARFALYVPALYATEVDDATGMTVIGAPLDPRVPARVARAMVRDLDAYPFPVDAPVPYAEAVFERASVEIARGCTEGCRFCQAGMIYRPVRERSPQSIADSLLGGVDRAGYDETGLTCLSTADFSSISPLVTKLAAELRQRGVSMSVASLRAYGLSEELLDELAQTRITGLTFAPEAGTQRMRDVVNKNVTEAHIEESTRRVFARGWHRLKLYFMIGLPTEGDDDVRGIVETGLRMLQIGRRELGARAEVTVSVSSHVPKPHTPFQWCAQDPHAEIERKQWLLRDTARRERSLRLKHHHSGISWVEGLLARGDRRLADVIEAVWRAGARFDGWDEVFELERWQQAMQAAGLEPAPYLGTRPVAARLPWDHIDVGLEDGFLLGEYRRALAGRASPPCGKVAGQLVHHANLVDASADARRLVCYDCGVACDLTKMRDDRLVALRTLGAEAPRARRGGALPIVDDRTMLDVAERGGGSPAEAPSPIDDAPRPTPRQREQARAERVRLNGHKGADAPYATYRIHFAKVGRAAFLGHLDLGRLLARVFRRADLALAMSRGFSPKPRISFGPALGLGVPSLGEVIDVDLEHAPQVGGRFVRSFSAPDDAPRAEVPAAEVEARLRCVCPEGVVIAGVELLPPGSPGLGRVIAAVDLLVRPAPDGIMFDGARVQRLADRFLSAERVVVQRPGKHGTREAGREIDVRALVQALEVVQGDAARALCEALDWPASAALLRARVKATAEGSVRPVELARALGVWGADDPRAEHALLARAAVVISPPEVAPTLAPLPPADAGVGDVASA